ncbi:MAG: hypothetical protein AB1425_06550 [Actinomycetota bacterium]
MSLVLAITPRFARGTALCLAAAVVLLTTLSTLGQVLHHLFEAWSGASGEGWLRGLIRGAADALYVDNEKSLPTVFTSYLLLLCAHFLGAIALASRPAGARQALRWVGLSLIFAYLFVDEAYGLHEKTIEPLRAALGTSGLLYFAWIIPAAVLVFFFVLAYLRFLIGLPAPIRLLFLVAGAIFVGGALGMEAIGGYFWELHGPQSLWFVAAATVEESMEMLGLVVLLYALMLYASLYLKRVKVRLGTGGREP